jgi:DNA-binding PadR family transcriptional regulator
MVDRAFLVLLALHRAPSHGYAIKRAVLDLSGGALDLEPGGLYRLIARLEDEGLVEAVAPPANEVSKGPPRNYYAITDSGKNALADESVRLRRLVSRPEFAAILRSATP